MGISQVYQILSPSTSCHGVELLTMVTSILSIDHYKVIINNSYILHDVIMCSVTSL